MRQTTLRLLPVAFTLALYGVACDAPLDDDGTGDDVNQSSDPETAEGAAVSDAAVFHAVYRFQGSFDPATGLTFEPAVLDTTEFRTAEQAMWCGMPIIADGVAGSGPVDTVEVVGELGTVNTYEECFPGGVYPSLTFANGGALCQDVTVRSFFDTESLTNVHAVIDDLSDLAYIAYNVPPITGAPSPGGDNLPNISRGLWSYGDLGPAGSGTNAATEQWIFNYPQAQSFRFSGRVIAAFTEVCAPTNTVDDDCDGRANEGCREYALAAACQSNIDCQSVNCDPATLRCVETTCGDGLFNGTETDLDCGGLCAAKCVNGDTCSVNSDCLSNVCRTGTCAAFRAPAAGEVVVTEVLANPQGDDELFEWFELTNVTGTTLDLTSCVLTDAGVDNHPIASTVNLPAGGRIVIGANGNSATNGGLNVAYAYGTTYQISNTGDEIRLTCDGTLIDAYVVPSSQLGYASQVSTGVETASANDVATNSCRATTSYGTNGNFGTPGAANTACELSNVNCRVTRPVGNFNAINSSPVITEVLVNIPGLTDLTNRLNASTQLQLQAAFVPTGTDPATFPDGNWTNASGVSGASGSSAPFGGSDLYRTTVTVSGAVASTGKLVYRVRGSSSAAWALCDADAQGSFDGFLDVSLPTVTIVAAAPTPTTTGQFQLTEFLVNGFNPTPNPEHNEFAEFRNATDSTLDLNGCTFEETGGTDIVIGTATPVPPGGYVLLARTTRQFTAPGAVIVPFGPDWGFSNSSGVEAIRLRCGPNLIASVTYNEGTQGIAQQLAPTLWGAGTRPAADYCEISVRDASTLIGTGAFLDYGTPGRDNLACAPLNPISACYLNGGASTAAPNTFNAVANASTTVTARVEIPGLTNNSNSNNLDGRVVGEIGFGPADTDPTTDESAYTWNSVTPTAAFTTTSGEDQYQASVAVPTAGTYALVGRFSQDGGDTWTYCDTLDEAAGGNVFDLALADVLSISAAPTIVDCSIQTVDDGLPLEPASSAVLVAVTSTLPGAETAALLEVQAGVVHSSLPVVVEADFNFGTVPYAGDLVPGVLGFVASRTLPDFATGSAAMLGRVRLAGTSAWTYCGDGTSASTLPTAIPTLIGMGPFPLGTVTHQTPAATSVLQGGTLSLSARAFIEGLTNRTAGAEQSSTVTVRHSFEPSANAANFDGVPTFDTGYLASNTDVEYDIAVSTAALPAGTYNSQWEVCVSPGVCATSAVVTLTVTVTPVWINELQYAVNDGTEGVEIAGLVGTNLSGYTFVYRAASGGPSGTDLSLSGLLTSAGSGVGTRFFARSGMSTAGHAALVNPSGVVVDHISWGSVTNPINSGPALNSVSTPTGVTAGSGNSITRTGSGCSKSEFSSFQNSTSSLGTINPGQTVTCPAPVLPPVDSCSATFAASAYIGSPVTANVSVTLAGVTDAVATADPLLEIESQLLAATALTTEPTTGYSTVETFVAQVGSAHTYTVSTTFPEATPVSRGYVVRARYANGPWTYCYADGAAPGTYNSARVPTATPTAYGTPTLAQQAVSPAGPYTEGTATLTYAVRMLSAGLTNRGSNENSPLVQVEHAVFPSAGSPTTWNTATFDTGWPVGNSDIQYTSARAITGLAPGTYISRFRVRIDGGAWVESGDQTITINAAAVASTPPSTASFCMNTPPSSGNSGTINAAVQSSGVGGVLALVGGLNYNSAVGSRADSFCADTTGVTITTFDTTATKPTSGGSKYVRIRATLTPGAYTLSFWANRNANGPTRMNVWMVPASGTAVDLFADVTVLTTNFTSTTNPLDYTFTSNQFTVDAASAGLYEFRVYGWAAGTTTGTFRLDNVRIANSAEVLVPAGSFSQGSPFGGAETPYTATLTRNFVMQTSEVTQAQWVALSGGTNPSCFQQPTGGGGGGCTAQTNSFPTGPVERVDWNSALAYANELSVANGLTPCYTIPGCADPTNGWKDGLHSGCGTATFAGLTCNGYRLPTESEWERAARGGTTTLWFWGDSSATISTYAWWGGNTAGRTQPVRTRTANAYGLFDMSGNVWEWVWDAGGNYPASPTVDYLGPAYNGSYVFRGGSCVHGEDRQRSAHRLWRGPGVDYDLGFRLVRTL